MKLCSDTPPLAAELKDPEIRRHTVEAQIRIGVPFQIRSMREKAGWTQATLAEELGTTQNAISRLENPRTGKPNIRTLLKIASTFDVGLLVRFVPFSFYGDVIEAMDETHVEIPSYSEQVATECRSDMLRVQAAEQGKLLQIPSHKKPVAGTNYINQTPPSVQEQKTESINQNPLKQALRFSA